MPTNIEELQDLEVEMARGYLMKLTPEKRSSVIQSAKEKIAEEAMKPGLTVMQLEDIETWKRLLKKFDN